MTATTTITAAALTRDCCSLCRQIRTRYYCRGFICNQVLSAEIINCDTFFRRHTCIISFSTDTTYQILHETTTPCRHTHVVHHHIAMPSEDSGCVQKNQMKQSTAVFYGGVSFHNRAHPLLGPILTHRTQTGKPNCCHN